MRNTYRFSPDDFDVAALLADLRRWVAVESPSHDRAAVNRMMDLAAGHAARIGLSVTRHVTDDAHGDVVIARNHDGSGPAALLLAHLDTVHPVGTLDTSPWREEGERIYGPGIYDMKSGALMALYAAAAIGTTAPLTIVFIPDEETGTFAGRSFVEALAPTASAALVLEPAREGGKIVTARRGGGHYMFNIIGRAAHSGTRPQDGRSAIREAAKLILRLEALNDPARGIGVNVGLIRGGTTRNTIPGTCTLEVDIRLPDPAAQAEVLAAIDALVPEDPDVRYDVTRQISRPPFAEDSGIRALFARAAPIAAAMGYPLVAMASGGGSDGNFTAALGVPTLDGLGPDGADAHSPNEHIFPATIAPRLAMLANLVVALGQGESAPA
ncbi:glutamate carboxypeptidase [Ketogulonicigenium robustum]|uniref:Glutamate carboxypeptidase n=1 Tax=Ketogulonicigenium robustum TaxID=92947 RepID=A0A1W6P1I6_9RHOB|nr:M20 family metallopeptidase [Ketogulonicigenium robustum]ARO15304.1 glutamate carboxypeptidase [Ketogulonicigenium robustum]